MSPTAADQPVSSSLVQQSIRTGCYFLETLYNPSLRLVRETPNSRVYYVASDNLLAQAALAGCNPAMSGSIQETLKNCCNYGSDMMHESLLGDPIPLPIHTDTITVLANSPAGFLWHNVTSETAGGDYTIFWERHNGLDVFPDCAYADVTVYTFLELKRRGNQTGAQQELDCLNQMYDGKGMVDKPFKNGTQSERGVYQTFKTALYLYVLQLQSHPFPVGLEESLLRTQGSDGGFHTGYDPTGASVGTKENAETTSIVMIALNSTIPPVHPVWIIYAAASTATAGGAIILLVLFREHRRKTLSHPSAIAKGKRFICTRYDSSLTEKRPTTVKLRRAADLLVMTEVVMARFDIKKGQRDIWLKWCKEAKRRQSEVLETMRNEGVVSEACFLSADEEHVYYFM